MKCHPPLVCLWDFLVFGVGDLFFDDGSGVAGCCGFLSDGAGDFFKVGILALVAGKNFALPSIGVFLFLVVAAFLFLLPLTVAAHDVIHLLAKALHVEPSPQQGNAHHEE